jgi:plastocyanin
METPPTAVQSYSGGNMKNVMRGLLLGSVFLVSSAQAATVTVNIVAGRFVPAHMEVNVGDTVEFINTTKGVHTVTADPDKVFDRANVRLPSGVAPFNSGGIKPGAKFTRVFDVAGQYGYVCLPHERMGMLGEIEVVIP